jgi:hypothetical protein
VISCPTFEGLHATLDEEAASECTASGGSRPLLDAEPASNHHLVGVVKTSSRLALGLSLAEELRKASPVGRVCGLKGLATAMSLDALCAPLKRRTIASSEQWGACSLSFSQNLFDPAKPLILRS